MTGFAGLETRDVRRPGNQRPGALSTGFLQRFDLPSLRAFLALGHDELNALPLGKRLESRGYNCIEVRKNIRAVFLLDKAVAFALVEPLDGACSDI